MRNVIFFTILFVALNKLAVNQAALANDIAIDTVDSALLELENGIFAENSNYSLGLPSIVVDSNAAISAPIPGSVETTQIITIPTPNIASHPNNNPIFLHKVIPIILEHTINSTLIRVGQEVRARLKENLYYGNRLVAGANSVLNGHIIAFRNSRTLACALMQTEDKLKSGAAIEISFDTLLPDTSSLLPLSGRPVRQESIRVGSDGFLYGVTVDRQGKIVQGGRTLSKEQKRTYNTLRVATNIPIPAGILLNLTAAPVIMGAVGAASPEIAFNRPLEADVKHKRIKGMAYGVVTNLPGAFFVQSVVEKGNEIVLNKGDELMIDITINEPIRRLGNPPPQSESLNVKAEIYKPAALSSTIKSTTN